MNRLKLKKLNESGMASILITMFLIIIMSLMVMAMSKNANREQRQSLDRQLSDQAFYNAMTGINDWARYITSGATTVSQKSACTNTGFTNPPSSTIDGVGTGNNSVTCVMYNTAPGDLQYSLSLDKGATVKLQSSSAIDTITFNFSSSDSSSTNGDCFPGITTMPTGVNAGCNVGGLEVNLVDLTSYTRDNLRNNNFIGYFLPSTSGTSNPIVPKANGTNPANQGLKTPVKCTATGCSFSITIPSSSAPMMLHMKALYLGSKVSITASSGPNKVSFNGAQLMIDATGKAEDVLRRVQVRLPLNNEYNTTDISLRTVQDICKQFKVTKTDTFTNSVLTGTTFGIDDISTCGGLN